jgi:hypothetical protein
MSERLRHLQRQQALLREHLAWIDNEIAREQPAAGNPPVAAFIPPAVVTPLASANPDADALLEKYASDERQNPAAIRRGCFVVFIAAFAVLAAAVATIWLVFYR